MTESPMEHRGQRSLIAVVGASRATEEGKKIAAEVGRLVAQAGAVLVCGGLGGIMEAASRGACEAGGDVLGILPGAVPGDANPYVTLAVPTNMGHARNVIIAHTARAMIAVEGEYGTLSEMAVALKLGKEVVSIGSWPDLPGTVAASSADEAVRIALRSVRKE